MNGMFPIALSRARVLAPDRERDRRGDRKIVVAR
jgi:hypothetical protein